MRRVKRLHHVGGRSNAFEAKPLGRLVHERNFVTQGFEKPNNSVPALRGTQEDGADQPFPKLPSEIIKNSVPRRLHVGEELLHQLVVVVCELLEHMETGFLLPFLQSLGHLDDL